MLQLDLLGGFHVRATSGEQVQLPTRKSEALLAFLALYPDRAHSRETLMNLLWGDRSTTQARNSLRQALSSLRSALPDSDSLGLRSDRATVRLDPDTSVVDALELERVAAEGGSPRLDVAAATYRGEFLAGMVIRDAAAEDWLETERRRFHRAAVAAFTRLLAEQVGRRELDAAIRTGERLVDLDPLNETAWRSLIGVYAQSGRRNDALDAYQRCHRKTTTELGVDPEPETRELEAAVRDRVFAGKAAQDRRAEAPRPVLPQFAPTDRPTLLVLPFAAQGLEAACEFLADGVTEDLTINLSRYRELYVMAPATAFVYATRSAGLSPAAYGRELRATYLVTGSVRPAGVQFRLSVQLLEVATSRCVWADQFHFAIEDWLRVESEIAGRLAASLVEGIEEAVRIGPVGTEPLGLPAYIRVARARRLLWNYDQIDNRTAQRLLGEAIELNPAYAPAYAHLAFFLVEEWEAGWHGECDAALGEARLAAERALALDALDAIAHAALGAVCLHEKSFAQAERRLNRAIECNPNLDDAYCFKSWVLAFTGRTAEVMACSSRSLRMNPMAPDGCIVPLVMALYLAERHEESIDAADRLHHPDAWAQAFRAASLAKLGRTEEAESAARDLRDRDDFRAWLQRRTFQHERDQERVLEGFRAAGILNDSSA